jgi:uncharacterized membrane protein
MAALGWIALFQPYSGMKIWGLALGGVLVAFVAVLIRSGQGGSRRAAAVRAAGDSTPDECWKWGLLYINPADPAILVEKRFGIGYTLNLGNHWSWVVMGLLFLPAVVALVFIR